jgi:hypothetical protein
MSVEYSRPLPVAVQIQADHLSTRTPDEGRISWQTVIHSKPAGTTSLTTLGIQAGLAVSGSGRMPRTSAAHALPLLVRAVVPRSARVDDMSHFAAKGIEGAVRLPGEGEDPTG